MISKYINEIILLLFFSVMLTGCQMDLFDNFDDYTPVVELTSIETEYDTTVLTGKILDYGKSTLEYIGFCYNSIGYPDLSENQILVSEIYSDNTFIVYTTNLFADSVYYFRAFAANEYGYSISATQQYQVPVSAPLVVPCSLANNRIIDDGISYSFNSSSIFISPETDYYKIRISYTLSRELNFYFKTLPQNGIYTTNSSGYDQLGYKEVFIQDNTDLTGVFTIHDNESVYVENTTDSLIVSFCNLTYSTSNTILKGKFIKTLN